MVMQIQLTKGAGKCRGRVTKCLRDNENNVICRAYENLALGTHTYGVEFEDVEEAELSANVIAQSMYAQCKPRRNTYVMFNSFIGYRGCITALDYTDHMSKKKDGRTCTRRSTRGWQLHVLFKDGSKQWIKLSVLKASHPLECAEYDVGKNLQLEHDVIWWVQAELRGRERIINIMKKRNSLSYLKKNEMIGICLPNNVTEAKALDKANGNTMWADVTAKEL